MFTLQDIEKLHVDIDEIENDLITERDLSLSILRLDKLHPEISGNKFFKLYYFLKEATGEEKKIITFGGAYSNHLAAAASACEGLGITAIGIVRGEEPKELSHTLQFCKDRGMLLEFISRDEYKRKDDTEFKAGLTETFGPHILIHEGGSSEKGVYGAALIPQMYKFKNFTHVCCAVGTATTIAGLITGDDISGNIIGFSAIKELGDFENRIHFLSRKDINKNYCLINDYHFGGYAKKTRELISFMNDLFHAFKIPTDFVYTAKMMFGVFDLIKKKYFPAGSKILCIHTGGLQGNLSLPGGTLNF